MFNARVFTLENDKVIGEGSGYTANYAIKIATAQARSSRPWRRDWVGLQLIQNEDSVFVITADDLNAAERQARTLALQQDKK